jgi:cytochrome c553
VAAASGNPDVDGSGADGTSARTTSVDSASKATKKRELQDKLSEIRTSHRKERVDSELRAALLEDSMDGLQIFRQSYRNWKNKKPAYSSTF